MESSKIITEQSSGDTRHFALDVMRVVSCFLVVLVHTVSTDITGGGYQRLSSFDWISQLALGSIARPAMPLFIMLSGALMLHHTRQHYGKYLLLKSGKLIGLYLLFAAGYIWLSIAMKDGLYNEARLLPDILGGFGVPYFHLYFLLILLGLYLITPLLSAMRHLSTATILTGIAGLVVLTNIDLLLREYQNVALGQLSLHDRFIAYLPYYIMGYVMLHRWGGCFKYDGLLTTASFLVIMATSYGLTRHADQWAANIIFSYENILVMALSLGLFSQLYRMGRWCEKQLNAKQQGIILWMAKQSLWVYLLHIAALRLLENLTPFAPLSQWSYQPLKALVMTLVVVSLCYALLKLITSVKVRR